LSYKFSTKILFFRIGAHFVNPAKIPKNQIFFQEKAKHLCLYCTKNEKQKKKTVQNVENGIDGQLLNAIIKPSETLFGKEPMKNLSNTGEFVNLHKKDIREQVFEQLLMKITMGEWKSGEKLPSENELSAAMGVSRISVREAIQKLAAINLVETFRGKGTYVKAFSTNNYLKSMTPMLYMSKEDIKSVLEYRRILEIGIIDLYLRNVKERDINDLQKMLDKMESYYKKKDLNKYRKYDVEFHMKLYEMTDNPFIIKISVIVKDVLNSSIEGGLTEEGAGEGVEFHTQILDCIRRKDADRLKIVISDMLRRTEEGLDKKYEK